MFTTQNIPLILVLAGCLALLTGLFGGGFTIKDYSIPKITALPRVMSGLAGMALIGGAMWLYARPAGPPVPAPTEATHTATPAATATFTPSASPMALPSATVTLTPAPGTPTAIPATSTPIVADPTNPVGFLRYYFDLLTVHRDYGDAWQLLSKRYQKVTYSNDYVAYGAYWDGIKQVQIADVQLSNVTISGADAHADMILVTTTGLTNNVSTTYHLIYDSTNHTWLFDSP